MVSQATANKRKGSRWESEVQNGFRRWDFEYEQIRLQGALDEGDGWIRHAKNDITLVEAKSGAMQPAHMDEVLAEKVNFAKRRGIPEGDVYPIVIYKRRGKKFEDALVVTTVRDFFGLVEAEEGSNG